MSTPRKKHGAYFGVPQYAGGTAAGPMTGGGIPRRDITVVGTASGFSGTNAVITPATINALVPAIGDVIYVVAQTVTSGANDASMSGGTGITFTQLGVNLQPTAARSAVMYRGVFTAATMTTNLAISATGIAFSGLAAIILRNVDATPEDIAVTSTPGTSALSQLIPGAGTTTTQKTMDLVLIGGSNDDNAGATSITGVTTGYTIPLNLGSQLGSDGCVAIAHKVQGQIAAQDGATITQASAFSFYSVYRIAVRAALA